MARNVPKLLLVSVGRLVGWFESNNLSNGFLVISFFINLQKEEEERAAGGQSVFCFA